MTVSGWGERGARGDDSGNRHPSPPCDPGPVADDSEKTSVRLHDFVASLRGKSGHQCRDTRIRPGEPGPRNPDHHEHDLLSEIARMTVPDDLDDVVHDKFGGKRYMDQ